MKRRQSLPQVWPPPVSTLIAAWHEESKTWTGHRSADAAAQYASRLVNGIQRRSEAPTLWERTWDGSWSRIECPSRPYGARSGRAAGTRLEIVLCEESLLALDEARGHEPRASWAKREVERSLRALGKL